MTSGRSFTPKDPLNRQGLLMPFNRWNYPWTKSWAYYVFKKHHTQLNAMWWAHHSASRHSATTAHNVGLASKTIQAFPAAVIHPSRQDLPLSEWLDYYKTFDNWVRLSACLSMCSYFEHYLYRMVTLSIASDPGVLLGKTRAIDGAAYLKTGNNPIDLKPHIESITKGTWQARVAAYERLFAAVPAVLSNNVADLDRIRELRNKVGHRFGRSLEDGDISPLAGLAEPERLSEERLAKWLGIIEKTVTAIDDHLRMTHVGAYEVLLAYSEIKKDLFAKGWRDRRLSRHFPDKQGGQLATAYCREAISYYDGL